MEANSGNIVLVTVATFPEAMEAHIYRNRLEADGIPCVLADENIISNQPWHSIAYGGVKLRVREQDVEIAQEIINEIRHGLTSVTGVEVVCPNCGSEKIKISRNVSVLKQVLVAIFMGTATKTQKAACLNCKYQWQF